MQSEFVTKEQCDEIVKLVMQSVNYSIPFPTVDFVQYTQLNGPSSPDGDTNKKMYQLHWINGANMNAGMIKMLYEFDHPWFAMRVLGIYQAGGPKVEDQ